MTYAALPGKFPTLWLLDRQVNNLMPNGLALTQSLPPSATSYGALVSICT